MESNRTFGGFLQLERLSGKEYHDGLYAFNLGRTAFALYVKENGYKRIYLPYYLCDSLEEAIVKANITIERYSLLRNLHPDSKSLPGKMEDTDLLVVVNYFSCLNKQDISDLKKKYGNVLIDNTQAFFQKPLDGVDTLYTCRKWFGVADGAYLYTAEPLDNYCGLPMDHSAERLLHLALKLEDENGDYYTHYHSFEESFSYAEPKQMSMVTRNLMGGIDYNGVAEQRKKNYAVLAAQFDGINSLANIMQAGAVPFMYPLYTEKAPEIRLALRDKRCFLPMLWPNVLEYSDNVWEKKLTQNTLLLPCDQRYNEEDMKVLAQYVGTELEK
ncbi:MAG: hypothetical protein E7277_08615 [Lachnospiraceae bacterium]|jgi:hypothetical protein|nr:hypothetical protein [Lachnospiraceae bacterium]